MRGRRSWNPAPIDAARRALEIKGPRIPQLRTRIRDTRQRLHAERDPGPAQSPWLRATCTHALLVKASAPGRGRDSDPEEHGSRLPPGQARQKRTGGASCRGGGPPVDSGRAGRGDAARRRGSAVWGIERSGREEREQVDRGACPSLDHSATSRRTPRRQGPKKTRAGRMDDRPAHLRRLILWDASQGARIRSVPRVRFMLRRVPLGERRAHGFGRIRGKRGPSHRASSTCPCPLRARS